MLTSAMALASPYVLSFDSDNICAQPELDAGVGVPILNGIVLQTSG
jgi:hypothetical protein